MHFWPNKGLEYADFTQITRSKTVPAALSEIGDLEDVVGLLLALIFPPGKRIRLLGVSLLFPQSSVL